jgi:hypothetical protein
MTQAAIKGTEKEDEGGLGMRGDFIEVDDGPSARTLPVVRIDGPYGAPAEDVFRCEVAVLIGAGIGKWSAWRSLFSHEPLTQASLLSHLFLNTYGIVNAGVL